jgi:hypothetical protein
MTKVALFDAHGGSISSHVWLYRKILPTNGLTAWILRQLLNRPRCKITGLPMETIQELQAKQENKS